MKNKLFVVTLLALPFITNCKGGSAYLDEINKTLAENESKINTCYDAVCLVGDKLSEHKLDNDKEYAYDSLNKKFVVLKDDNIVEKSGDYTPSDNTLDYFKFVTTYDANSKYSQYLLKEAETSESLLITTGFDSGSHRDIKYVAYDNESRDSSSVIVRAYCDYLSVLAPTQTITHYEEANNVIITECDRYNEHGEIAYMKASDGDIYISNDNDCALDMFEKVSGKEDNVTLSYEKDSRVYGLINCDDKEIIEGSTAYELKEKKITSAAEFREYVEKSHDEKFLRLESDILFNKGDGEGAEDLNPIVVDHNLCIDLNGFKLSFSNFKTGKSTMKEAMRIQSEIVDGKAVDRNLYLIDSQGVLDEHSGISLNDCSIVIAGCTTKQEGVEAPTSNLIFNSGKITQTVTNKDTGPAIIVLGKTDDAQPDKNTNFTMYGGKISCNNTLSASENNLNGCVGAVGKGAVVNIEFGVLSSNDFCIYGSADDTKTNTLLSDAIININGGTLTSSRNSAIYFPSKADINIEGGKIYGESCLSVTAGDLSINSAILKATGSGSYSKQGVYDGSVIYVPKDRYDAENLTVEVANSTLTSTHAYIASVNEATNQNKTIFNFASGTYNYKLGEGIFSENEELVKVSQKNGTWNKSQY